MMGAMTSPMVVVLAVVVVVAVVVVKVLTKGRNMTMDSPEEWKTVRPVLAEQSETGTR